MGLQSKWNKLTRYVSYLGPKSGLTIAALEGMTLESKEVSVSHGSLRRPVVLRTRSSDFEAFVQVIAEQEYNVPEMPTPETIIDAGANVGLASVFFAEKFPNAKILAIEPVESNFNQLCKNVKDYPNVTCIKKALWTTTGTIQLFDPGMGEWSVRADPETKPGDAPLPQIGSAECVTVSELMSQYGLTRIDLLKVDIEGAEKEVFAASSDWIDKVDAIAIELHDRFKRGCSQAFYTATASFPHEVHKGELVFLFRELASASESEKRSVPAPAPARSPATA
jgi:FkbM family methyltransferase